MFGEKLRQARKNKNITQKQLAELLYQRYGWHIKHNTVSDWESGRTTRVDVEVAAALCALLDIEAQWLLSDDDLVMSKKTVKAKEKFIKDELDNLPEEARNEIDNFIEFVKNKYKNRR